MKKLLLLKFLSILLFNNTFAQDSKSQVTNKPDIPEVILPSDEFMLKLIDTTVIATKNELYNRAYTWIATNYKSANAVIQMQDKDAGKIIAKGNFKVLNGGYLITHQLTIDVKDNRYRVLMNNFYHDGCPVCDYKVVGGDLSNEKPIMSGWTGINKVQWKKTKEETKQIALESLKSLANEMKIGSKSTDNDGF